MIIGSFVHDAASDTYRGDIQTLTVKRRRVWIIPTGTHGEGTRYRVAILRREASIELGEAWRRHDTSGKAYLLVRLDDPALPAPFDALLLHDGDEDVLLWSRDGETMPPPSCPAQAVGR